MTAAVIATMSRMGRWKPDAPGRLQRAALGLYAEQGYDQTTVAEIAARAGLTERTFFRHFADKREVLFDGAGRFEAAIVAPVDGAPPSATPLDAVGAGIEAAGSVLPALELVRRRHAVILANPELQERELIKLASLAASIAAALRRRGVTDTAAELAAQTGVAVLQVALARWIGDPAEQPWEFHVREAIDELYGLTANRSTTTHGRRRTPTPKPARRRVGPSTAE